MGHPAFEEIDAGLRQGALVVTASERAARALTQACHQARRAEGLSAWATPNIRDWNTFVRETWQQFGPSSRDNRLLLNATQEQALWAAIAASSGHAGTLLPGSLHRFAAMAMEAHQLLCSYAPRLLRASARTGWQNDAAAFSQWLAEFDDACRSGSLVSAARLPFELTRAFEDSSAASAIPRPPLLLAGFDRILPVQRALFDAWGPWREVSAGQPAAGVRFHQAADDRAELAACARWCAGRLAEHPDTRILLVSQDVSRRRGQMERAFLDAGLADVEVLFEFSLGIPLGRAALPRAAHLWLRWLGGPLAEHELDWLFSSGHAAEGVDELLALQAHMRAIRRRSLQRPQWTMDGFASALGAAPDLLSSSWIGRARRAQERLADANGRTQSPLEWAALVPKLLQDVAWPGAAPLSSGQFQAERRLMQATETAGSLGFDGRRIGWADFLSDLGRILDDTLFVPESRDAPVQIAGPAESAGLTADALWFLGAAEDAWPAAGRTHPLLPPEVQREFKMPHALPQLDWELSEAITTRLLASADEVNFSHARQIDGTSARPSRLVVQLAGPAQPMPAELAALALPDPLTELLEDFTTASFPAGIAAGGAYVLSAQSQCPFKAFATARLGARGWDAAEAGLTASQRGLLLHAVLHSVWAGPPGGIRSWDELHAKAQSGLNAFAAEHVQFTFERTLPPGARERMPARYLELEAERLTRLVAEWLALEAARVPFTVAATEAPETARIEGLMLKVRLDRIDRLADNSLLVIDYKTGDVKTKAWALPRPDDVQLPLYARFALDSEAALGGLAFAKIRAGNGCFEGLLFDAGSNLFPGLNSNRALVKNPLTLETILGWELYIERMARDFLAGRAEVDPRDYPKTCKNCGLQTLCRIQEHRLALDPDDDAEDDEAGDA